MSVSVPASRFIFVGDVHLNHATPSSRRDDYGAAVLAKLRWVFEESLKRKCEVIVFSGDMFHQKKQPVSYLVQVISLFTEFKEKGLSLFSIVGNHDLSYDREDTLSLHPISVLFESNLLNRLEVLELRDRASDELLATVQGCDYPDKFPLRKSPSHLSFLVAHRYYEDEKESYPLTYSLVESLGFDFYLLGHDHAPYKELQIPNDNSFSSWSRVVRQGSLTRGTSHDYQLEREIQVVFFDVSNPMSPKHTYVSLPIQPAEEVFVSQVFSKDESAKALKEGVKERVEGLISVFESAKGSASLDLSFEGVPPKVRTHIQEKMREKGLFT